MSSTTKLFAFLLCLLPLAVHPFPDGAPDGVCHKDPAKAVREPHHGNATAQPADSLPYTIFTETDRFAAGQTVQISISAIDGETVFRGFYVQALDAKSGRPLGRFLELPNTKLLSDCATITHADPKDKLFAFLVWQAPSEPGHGGVKFM